MTARGGSGRSRLAADTSVGSPGLMHGLATVGFLVNFWAWALISPLGVAYREQLGLTAFQQALLVAVPVVVAFRRPTAFPNDHPHYLGMTGYGAATVR